MEGDSTDTPTADGRDRGRLVGAIAALVAAVAVIAFLAIGLANRDAANTIDAALDEGRRPAAPEIRLPVLSAGGALQEEGATVSLSDLRGAPVLVNVWASWCGPCRDEAPILEALWRDYREKGVVVLGIDVQDLSDDARAFIREQRLTFPSLRDSSSNTERELQTSGVPETFLLDAEGRIALAIRGPINEERARGLRDVIDGLL